MSRLDAFENIIFPPGVTHLMEQKGNLNFVYAISEITDAEEHVMLTYRASIDGSTFTLLEERFISTADLDEYKRGLYGCSVVDYVLKLEND